MKFDKVMPGPQKRVFHARKLKADSRNIPMGTGRYIVDVLVKEFSNFEFRVKVKGPMGKIKLTITTITRLPR